VVGAAVRFEAQSVVVHSRAASARLWWCTAALPVLVALAALTAPASSFSAPNPIYNLLLYAFCLDLIVVIVLAVRAWRRSRR
jgi:uncharacterized membrane protein YjdF